MLQPAGFLSESSYHGDKKKLKKETQNRIKKRNARGENDQTHQTYSIIWSHRNVIQTFNRSSYLEVLGGGLDFVGSTVFVLFRPLTFRLVSMRECKS